MNVVGTVGLPGSGKGEAASVAAELDIPVITMGDVIREECRARGLDPSDHHGEIAVALREENGPGAIAERSLKPIRDALETHDTVLIDGIRSDAEVERFLEAFGDEFTLVAITAPFELRKDRLSERQRDDPSVETLEERDTRELGFGMGAAIEMADETIENTESIEAYHKQVRRLLEDDE
ncbi:AAA family ATPase [Halocatena halophila]|uniref:AAA family ATPase n=1 Tax=Halocatena halophila TaxID=2814576 RepID=UPI002ECFC07E